MLGMGIALGVAGLATLLWEAAKPNDKPSVGPAVTEERDGWPL